MMIEIPELNIPDSVVALFSDEGENAILQEAAAVLLESVPNPAFDILKPILMGKYSVSFHEIDEDGNKVYQKINIPWSDIKDIIQDALTALSQDTKETK